MAPELIVSADVDGMVAAAHLNNDVISQIVCKLPSKGAYSFAVVSKEFQEFLLQATFFRRHLSPPPLPVGDDVPVVLVVQPKGLRCGYSHLTIVSTDPTNPSALHVPVHRDYQGFAEHATPAPAVAASPPSDGDFVTFFQQTVPMLDVSVVASDGRLLLARSATGTYYVCFPAANRWIKLPPTPAVVRDRDTAVGFQHDVVDAELRAISFNVVLLTGDVVATFASETPEWKAKALGDVGVHDAALCLGAASPGIRAGNCIYWLLSASDHGRVVCFDVTRGRASILDEPPQAERFTKRVGMSLGSAGGRLSLCSFDIRDGEPANVRPHAVDGVHGVWVLDSACTWKRVREAMVDDISVSFFHVLHGPEVPVGFVGGATGYSSIIINKNNTLLRRDLGSGGKVELSDLYKSQYGRMAQLYRQFDVFPLFK